MQPKRFAARMAATIAVVVLLLMPATRPASAAPVTIQGCQPHASLFQMRLTGGLTWFSQCSGTYQINRYVYEVDAGAWSGVIYYGTRANWSFCNYERFDLDATVRYVVLYATKAPWCD